MTPAGAPCYTRQAAAAPVGHRRRPPPKRSPARPKTVPVRDPRSTERPRGGRGASLGSGFGDTSLELTSPIPDPEAHRRLVAFRKLTLALGSELDLTRRIHRAIREIRRIVGAERATVYLYDAAAGVLWSRVNDGQQAHALEVPVGRGIVGWVAQHLRPLNVKDRAEFRERDDEVDCLPGLEPRSVLAVPMMSDERELLGVVMVANKAGAEHFSGNDERLLVTLTQVLAINVEHARLHARTQAQLTELESVRSRLVTKVGELELLFDAAHAAAGASRAGDVAQRVAALLAERLDLRAAMVTYVPTGSTVATCVAVTPRSGEAPLVRRHDVPAAFLPEGPDDRLAGALGHLAGQVLGRDDPPTAVVAFPDSGHVRGALAIFARNAGAGVDDGQRKVLAVLASQVVTGLRRAFEMESERREDRLLTIGRTVSGMLHDLRTPIAVVRGFADLLRRDPTAEDRDRFAGSILDQLGRIERMAADVLAFARGEITVLPEKVYLRRFMDGIEQVCRTAFADRGVAFEFDLHDRGAGLFDEQKMERAVINLVRNAVEAMPDGGTCTVRLARVDDDLEITVEDTGVGIPEHLRDYVFERFTTHGKDGGTGLGLSMVRNIVEEHGGRVTLRSDRGVGTAVQLRFPAEFRAARRPHGDEDP